MTQVTKASGLSFCHIGDTKINYNVVNGPQTFLAHILFYIQRSEKTTPPHK